ncbi:MAG TPA: Lcl C-terminal domain-containing protein [Xylella fastidiosa subsp. multiplex]
MSTATLENVPTTEGARFTKIYDEHGKHIITCDAHTGLEWLAWNLNPSTNEYGPDCDAAKECHRLDIGAYNDWRVPTLEEALSANRAAAYLRWELGPWIWTCTPDNDDPRGAAWVVKFRTDYSFAASRAVPHHVRAVRGQMRTAATATPKAGES